MRLLDVRRLRGPNLQTAGPAAVAEVELEKGERASRAIDAWRASALPMANALGWRKEARGAVARRFPRGIAFALPAPIDVLLAATDVNEWAVKNAARALRGEGTEAFDAALDRFDREVGRMQRPLLVGLQREAKKRGVPFLWDDDRVTVGSGRGSRTFAIEALPPARKVPWDRIGAIPVALVTGTNGKTTTSRLLARIAKEAGKLAGCTSTDGIVVDERIVEAGDWTGPEAARAVLRRDDVDLAVLETARGGILRRGLAVDACDVAVVTNVTRDHLGEFGVFDLETMARAKCVVTTVVRRGGRVVLNADDARLVRAATRVRAPVIFFSRRLGPAARAHVRAGGIVYAQVDGALVRLARSSSRVVAQVGEVPIAFGGEARHNIDNALAAAAAAEGLRLPMDAVRRALLCFGLRPTDNPGRGHVLRLDNGVGVVLDFGHNPAGLRALFRLARSVASQAGRILMVATLPGDRSDRDFASVAAEIARQKPRLAIVWESEEYRRGRPTGEVAGTLAAALRSRGLGSKDVRVGHGEAASFIAAMRKAQAGDVVVLAPLIDREAVWAALAQLGRDANAAYWQVPPPVHAP